jgi:CRP-like cAMP-binding protein
MLRGIKEAKTLLHLRKKQRIFSEGEKADAVYFVRSGKVKITVLSPTGKEAVLALLGPQEFFGEECLADQPVRINTYFMNKFRKEGLIDYNGDLTIRPGLLTEAVLRD